jgi:putative hydrolase of the HAD superfamily
VKPPITCLIFDLGGVLVRLDYMKWCRAIGGLAGIPAEEIYARALSSGLGREFDRGSLTPREFVSRVNAEVPLALDDDEFRRLWIDIFERDAEMESLIARLAARLPLVMLSNVNVWHYEHLSSTMPVFGHFRELVLSFEEGLLKPDPRIYKKAAAAGGSDPAGCLYVDDVREYAEAAAQVGMTAIHFQGHASLVKRLAEAGLEF